ncbi:hypothetical protein ACLB2K_062734 [Fragaria x ananassa]
MNSELSQSTDSEKEEQAPQHSNAKGKSVAKRKRAEKKTKSTASSKHTKLRSWKSKSSTEVGSGSSSGRDSQNIYGKVTDMLADWEQVLENDESMVVSNEVDRYLLDPIEKPQADKKKEEFQLLLWWKLNGSKYPNLAAVAKDVLAIQVSTVASESSFSTGKRVIDPHKSSLTPKSVEALICLQNWLKSDSITNLAYVPTPKEMAWLEAVEEEQEKEDHEKKNKEQEASEAAASKSSKIAKSSSAADVSKTYKKSSGSHPELKYVETGIHGGNEAGKSGINMMKSIVFVFQS